MSKLISRIALSLLCLTVTVWAAGYLWFAWTIAQAKPAQLDRKTDAIVVLTGGNGRIGTGLRLLAAGASQELFISGVDPRVSIAAVRDMWKGPEILPECCITLGHEAGTTEGNADETRKWIAARGFTSIRLVTASSHMTRALLLFRHALPETLILPYPVQSSDFDTWSKPFWSIALFEYHKSIATMLRLIFFPDTPIESLMPR